MGEQDGTFAQTGRQEVRAPAKPRRAFLPRVAKDFSRPKVIVPTQMYSRCVDLGKYLIIDVRYDYSDTCLKSL